MSREINPPETTVEVFPEKTRLDVSRNTADAISEWSQAERWLAERTLVYHRSLAEMVEAQSRRDDKRKAAYLAIQEAASHLQQAINGGRA